MYKYVTYFFKYNPKFYELYYHPLIICKKIDLTVELKEDMSIIRF